MTISMAYPHSQWHDHKTKMQRKVTHLKGKLIQLLKFQTWALQNIRQCSQHLSDRCLQFNSHRQPLLQFLSLSLLILNRHGINIKQHWNLIWWPKSPTKILQRCKIPTKWLPFHINNPRYGWQWCHSAKDSRNYDYFTAERDFRDLPQITEMIHRPYKNLAGVHFQAHFLQLHLMASHPLNSLVLVMTMHKLKPTPSPIWNYFYLMMRILKMLTTSLLLGQHCRISQNGHPAGSTRIQGWVRWDWWDDCDQIQSGTVRGRLVEIGMSHQIS